ncbi:MAG: hypothetical protein Q4D26_09095 [Clostridia bacterium]|nr:hypothetical protein [Clostridia bacterium]
MANNYNKNYDFTYHTDDEEFDVEHMNENFNTAANEFDTVYDQIDSKANTNHSHNLSSTAVTGVLPVSKGGTGKYTLTSGQVLIGNGTNAVTTRAVAVAPNSGSTGLITSGGVYNALLGKADSNHSHILSEETVSGTLPVSKGGTGADNIIQARKNLEISKYCYVVAAADSNSAYKDSADYVLPDTNTAVLLNNYIEGLPEGVTLYFAPGTYNCSTCINLTKPINIVGGGYSTKIVGAFNNYNLFISDVSGIKIADVCLKKDDSSNVNLGFSDSLIKLLDVDRVLFNNVFFEYMLPDNVTYSQSTLFINFVSLVNFVNKATNINFNGCTMRSNFTKRNCDYNSVSFIWSDLNSSVFVGTMTSESLRVAYKSTNTQNTVSQCGNWNFKKIIDGVEVTQ